ncbi:MAG: methylenetetrahydrofolate reductase [NAD(P)H] [Myxococcales bacterium]|nr:methylenetetrahydrofolate reductase [NAD(P)H] [Myxococcales bacterium]
MRIADLYSGGEPVFSFEFFPPKTDGGYQGLYRTISELKRLDPGFVSVTCGAAGNTRTKTADLVARIQNDVGLTAMAHMVCTGTTREELEVTLTSMRSDGIENVLALRGDPPRDQPDWRPVAGGFAHADELIAFLKERFDFCIGGACYPEKHPEAPTPEADLERLVGKVAAGAEFLITQLFFDGADYWSFVERARSAGIEIPIVPGIMPVVSHANLQRMATLSPGTKIPEDLEASLAEAGDDPQLALDAGVAWATQQCRGLLDRGAPGIHFYTLNRSPATRRVHANLFRS